MSTEKLHIQTATREQLLALPFSGMDEKPSEYDSLLIFPAGTLHDSGWAAMAIVGCNGLCPTSLLTSCSDDIEWKINPVMQRYGQAGQYTVGQFRSDCAPASNALHLWNRGHKWRVGMALSSITIELV